MADAADPKGPSDDGAPSGPQIFQIEGEDWELPSYWNLREDAKPKLASATFYGRPDGSRHPDVLIVPDANGVRGGTVVRGKFIAKAKRHGAPSKRVPDCASDLWFAQGGGVMCQAWRRNYDATGDYRRHPKYGPAPPG